MLASLAPVVRRRPRWGVMVAALSALTLTLLLAACSDDEAAPAGSAPEGWSTTGTPTESADVVLLEERLVTQVTDALPVEAPLGSFDVTCEGDLAGVVGARQVCAIERDGDRTGALVETIAIEGETVQWREQYFLFASDLESVLVSQVRDGGGSVESVSCPSSLPAEEGAEMTCTATGGVREVAVTVTQADGLRIDFDFEAR